jgi:hypothetical protein
LVSCALLDAPDDQQDRRMTSSAISFPALETTLEPVCTIDVTFGAVPFFRTPVGTRMLFGVIGGRVEGDRLRGSVVPGSADWLTIGDDMIGRLDVRAVIETDDGATIQMTTSGRARLGERVGRFLAGETVTSEEAYIRSLPLFETSDDRYSYLNGLVTLALCDISLTGVHYRVYEIG